MTPKITFVRLTTIAPELIVAHMNDPRVAEHMPLLTAKWDAAGVAEFIATKESSWMRDGLGHWAFLADGDYIGWGGFQKEGEDWDFGMVLKPSAFGLGAQIFRKSVAFARADTRIPHTTFLLPPSRKSLGALDRYGAVFLSEVEYQGQIFLKYRLQTD